ncbi:unnamed protein product [Clonostachys solani]|uniref:Uncharacterized protein n=1 Tax=Clonostachys solani TaxID=160281 RepID=A0A9P0ELD6_9HYPO|nr:unnamed protein product [Clonostachys solani]
MVATKNLGLAGLVWLSLAAQGLALGVDEATNDLTLVERNVAAEELDVRDVDDELYERDFDEELDERDFDDELEERDFDDEHLEVRGGATVNLKEQRLTGIKANRPIPTPPKEVDTKAYWDKKYGVKKAVSGPAKYRRDLEARGGATINLQEQRITGIKANRPIPPPPKEIDTKAYWAKKYGHKRGLDVRGGATINLQEQRITGIKANRPIPPPPKEIDTKAYWAKKYGHKRGLDVRGGASINLKEQRITGIKANRPIPPPPKEIDTKAYWAKKYGKA